MLPHPQRDGGTQQTTYTYDEDNRLTGATYWDGTTQSYTYDGAGNRASVTQGGTTTSYQYDTAGRLLSAGDTTYSYDGAATRPARPAHY